MDSQIPDPIELTKACVRINKISYELLTIGSCLFENFLLSVKEEHALKMQTIV